MTAVNVLVAFVAVLHIWFLILEMALWTKPTGLKTFKMSAEKAAVTQSLAANQGLYNGFLAAGLIVSLIHSDPTVANAFRQFFLICVITAGIYGAYSVNRKIFFVQALPAIITLALTFL